MMRKNARISAGSSSGLPGLSRYGKRMTSDDRTIESPGETGGESPALQAPPWLLRQRITLPDRVAGYVHRAELMDRSMPTQRRLTVLKASGGFGKTTLLAECCRSLRSEGVPAAWVSVDERDEPEALDTYIAFACHGAGLDLLDLSDLEEAGGGPGSRVGLVVRKIQSFGKPFVIAFDELERLENPASVALLEYLLQRGPPNLHLAVACRQIPDGLNVSGAVLEGRAEVLASEDLRFSGVDVARFFDLMLSRSELAEEIDRSAGWPLALRISRNSIERGPEAGAGIVKDFVRNWIETRLFVDLGRDDRDFLLDLGLFDWIDAGLAGRGPAKRRLDAPAGVDGCAGRVAGAGERRRHQELAAASAGARALRQAAVPGEPGAIPCDPLSTCRGARASRRKRRRPCAMPSRAASRYWPATSSSRRGACACGPARGRCSCGPRTGC